MSSNNGDSPVRSPDTGTSKLNPSQELLNIGETKCLESLVIKKSKPFKVGPSSVLDRVKSFLPQMEEAKKQLDKKIAEGSTLDLDIENVDDCEGPIIEMNLALCARGGSSESDEESEEDENDSEEDNPGGYDELDLGDATLSKLKLPGREKKLRDGRTLIEVLPGEVSDDSGNNEGDKT